MALIRSAKEYDSARFDAACRRAIAIGSPNRKSVLAILSSGLEPSRPTPRHRDPNSRVVHENVRGGDYYDRKETDRS